MHLKAFRVKKFRNIEDSGEVELLDALTCVVGKNQAGKSALLRALHKFNPHLPDPYDMRSEWPRGQRTQRNNKQAVCEVRFTLSPEEVKKLAEIVGQEVSDENVVVTKDYEGNYFEGTYGAWGREFAEVHHVQELGAAPAEGVEVDPSTDLAVVCSNCHRMIHRKAKRALRLAELRKRMESYTATSSVPIPISDGPAGMNP